MSNEFVKLPKVPQGASSGRVWTSDASGTGSWTSLGLSVSPSLSNPTRSIGTEYQPNTTRPAMVIFCLVSSSNTISGVQMLIGSISGSLTHIGYLQVSSSNDYRMGTFWVPPAWYYRISVSNGSPGVDSWKEIAL